MKIETKVIVSSVDISRGLARARRSKNKRKNKDSGGTSRSGHSVLIKRTQGPRILNMFGPDDVFQREKMVNCEGRGEKKEKKHKVVSRA